MAEKPRKILFVQYCGGCNPLYDRVKHVEQTAAALDADVIYDHPERADYYLAVSGCPRGCVSIEGFPFVRTVGQETPAELAEQLKKIAE